MCMTETNSVVKCKSVFKPGVARHLIKMGNPVYDIKPEERKIQTLLFSYLWKRKNL